MLERPCPECGFDPAAQGLGDLPRLVHDTAMTWSEVLARGDVAERPAPDVWSPLEYGCHVRDVHVLFAQRLRAMLDEDEPTFANWDQDATALESDYAGQDATTVAVELIEAAGTVAGIYATVTDATQGPAGRALQRRPLHRRVARQLSPARRRPPPPRRRGGRWVTPSTRPSAPTTSTRRRTPAAPQVPDGVRADLEELAAPSARARGCWRSGRAAAATRC